MGRMGMSHLPYPGSSLRTIGIIFQIACDIYVPVCQYIQMKEKFLCRVLTNGFPGCMMPS